MTALLLAGPEEAPDHVLAGHPERPARVGAAMAGLDDIHLGDDCCHARPRDATAEELLRVHTPSHLARLEALSQAGGGRADPDTFATSTSWAAAVRAAGAGLAAVDGLRAGMADVAFVVARPPGHHARPGDSMGFCLLNNVAVAAAALAAAGERVVIMDWDVHHGNGTEEIFWDDPRVLYASTHQSPLYPGTGRVTDAGGPAALGLTINIPVPPGATGDVLRLALDEVVTPAVESFEPTWVLVSAGFDPHRDDPLADLRLSSGDFGALAATVARYAPGPGRLAVFLEGGYDLDALRASVAATIGSLVGAQVDAEAQTSGGPGAEAVERARLVRLRG